MSEKLYVLYCTEDADECYNEDGVNGLIYGLENDIISLSSFELGEIEIGNKKSVVDGLYKTSTYGSYFFIDKKEYDEISEV